jgi:hypothetical protein
MWELKETEQDKNHIKFHIKQQKRVVSNKDFLDLLKNDPSFVLWYNKVLADVPFDAFFWENKPMIQSNLDQKYECNVVVSDFLADVKADPHTFNNYFQPGREVSAFKNLGGDAKLIAPCPVSDQSIYAQIGSFVRKAPQSQIIQFWKMVGKETMNHIGSNPSWLSTSGLGVYWLHARIDSYPKYYQTAEYKQV